MEGSSKSKSNPHSSAHGSNNIGLAPGNQALSPRPDLDSQITASVSPVSLVKEAHSWLEKKGWILTSKHYSKSKLAEILFTTALSFKLQPKVDTALRSVVFLLHN
jgi:hypothetical protein